MALILLTKRTSIATSTKLSISRARAISILTTRYDDPYEIEEEVVGPEVVSFWSEVGSFVEIMVEKASGIVKYIAVYLTQGDQSLQRIAEWMLFCDHEGHSIGERTPEYLARL